MHDYTGRRQVCDLYRLLRRRCEVVNLYSSTRAGAWQPHETASALLGITVHRFVPVEASTWPPQDGEMTISGGGRGTDRLTKSLRRERMVQVGFLDREIGTTSCSEGAQGAAVRDEQATTLGLLGKDGTT